MGDRLFIKFSKCEFWLRGVQSLGHLVNQKGILVDSAKIEVVMQWEILRSPSEIQSFLGIAGYYRRFLRDFSEIVGPLTRLTKKSVALCWGPGQQAVSQPKTDKGGIRFGVEDVMYSIITIV